MVGGDWLARIFSARIRFIMFADYCGNEKLSKKLVSYSYCGSGNLFCAFCSPSMPSEGNLGSDSYQNESFAGPKLPKFLLSPCQVEIKFERLNSLLPSFSKSQIQTAARLKGGYVVYHQLKPTGERDASESTVPFIPIPRCVNSSIT